MTWDWEKYRDDVDEALRSVDNLRAQYGSDFFERVLSRPQQFHQQREQIESAVHDAAYHLASGWTELDKPEEAERLWTEVRKFCAGMMAERIHPSHASTALRDHQRRQLELLSRRKKSAPAASPSRIRSGAVPVWNFFKPHVSTAVGAIISALVVALLAYLGLKAPDEKKSEKPAPTPEATEPPAGRSAATASMQPPKTAAAVAAAKAKQTPRPYWLNKLAIQK